MDATAVAAASLVESGELRLDTTARHLLAVGYNLDDFRRDTSFYDLLASEARLATLVGVALGQLPQLLARGLPLRGRDDRRQIHFDPFSFRYSSTTSK